MNKMFLNPACYRLGLAILLFSFLISGCAGPPTNVPRYDSTIKYTLGKNENARKYSSYQEGIRYTIGRYDDATARYTLGRNAGARTYSSYQDGTRYTVGQYDSATSRYTNRHGSSSITQSKHMQASSAQQAGTNRSGVPAPGDHLGDMPMIIDVTDILFDFDKWVIRVAFVPELDRWADYFHNNPEVTAEIYGHADSTGPTIYNQKLSERRAQAVVNYLVGKGIDAARLTARGFGETQPAVPNTTREGRQKNRRVEMDL